MRRLVVIRVVVEGTRAEIDEATGAAVVQFEDVQVAPPMVRVYKS